MTTTIRFVVEMEAPGLSWFPLLAFDSEERATAYFEAIQLDDAPHRSLRILRLTTVSDVVAIQKAERDYPLIRT